MSELGFYAYQSMGSLAYELDGNTPLRRDLANGDAILVANLFNGLSPATVIAPVINNHTTFEIDGSRIIGSLDRRDDPCEGLAWRVIAYGDVRALARCDFA